MSQPIAIGVSAIKYGTVGDGVPATELTAFPAPYENSVVFNFQDATEVKIPIEGSTDPLYTFLVKENTDFVEFAFPSPTNAVVAVIAGGTVDVTGGKDVWAEPTSMPNVSKTIVIETEVIDGKKIVYTIVNGKLTAKPSQAPGKKQTELWLVRVYKQAAITTAGVKKFAFSREVVTVV